MNGINYRSLIRLTTTTTHVGFNVERIILETSKIAIQIKILMFKSKFYLAFLIYLNSAEKVL